MKYLKMLGLAAVAAMALMAVGAGTASATVLCTTTDTPTCTMAYGAGTEIHAVLKANTTAKLWEDPKGTEPLVTCNESTLKASTANAGSSTTTVSAPVDTTIQANGQMTGLSWGGCNHPTVTTVGGELEIHYIPGTHNATITAKNTKVTVSIGVNCFYGAGAGLDLGTMTGGASPDLVISVTVNKQSPSSFLCPEHAIWEAEYTITTPHAVFATES